MRLRLAASVGLVAAGVLLLAPAALACNFPTLHPASSAGPGDPVAYSVGNLDPGATYEIVVAGETVVSGGSAASGSFPMPDLGSEPQSVPAQLTVYHDDLADPYSEPVPPKIAYQPPAPPPVSPPSSNPQPDAQPQDAANDPMQGPAAAPSANQETSERSEFAPPPVGTEPAELSASPTLQPARASAESTGALAQARARTAVGAAEAKVARAAPLAKPRVLSSSAVEPDPAAVVAIALAIALILGSGGALLRAVIQPRLPGDGDRRVRVPIPVPREVEHDTRFRDLLIEAELQEMIAEARARKLVDASIREGTAERRPSDRAHVS